MNTNEVAPKVSWGVTSTMGVIGSLGGALTVLLTVIFKMDNDQAVAISGAVLAIVSFALTLWGRYEQAKRGVVVVPSPVVAEIPDHHQQ